MPRPRKQHHASFGSLTRLPSGRYRARYTGPDGLRRSAPVTFATKTAAEDWLARTRADMSRDQWTAPERGLVTLAEYLADWLDSRVDLRPTTVALYRQLSRRWLLTVHGGVDLGHLPVGAITPELVRRWYAGLVADTHTAAVQQAATTSNEAAAARDWAHTVGMPVAATGRLPAAVRTAWDDAGRPGAEPVRPRSWWADGPHRRRPDLPAAARRAQHRRPRRHRRHQPLPHRQGRARPRRRAPACHGAGGRDDRRRHVRPLPGGGARGRLVRAARG